MRSGTLDAIGPEEGLHLDEKERELAEAIVQTIAGLHPDAERPSRDLVDRLEKDGWDVDCHVAFVAEGRRRGVHETAVGRTRDEAVRELWNLTLLDAVEGCP